MGKRGPSPVPTPSVRELKRLYVDERLSPKKVGEHFGVGIKLARRWLDETGIYLLRNSFQKNDKPCGNYLYEEFILKDRTLKELASERKVSVSTINTWLREEGIFKYDGVAERHFGEDA